MHKDGSLFYAFQVHVSVTWNRGSRAGTGLGQVTGGAAGDFRFVSSRRGQAGFSQLLLTVSVQAQASPCHTQVPEPHHLQTSPRFLSWFYKTVMSCFIQGLLLLLSIHDLNSPHSLLWTCSPLLRLQTFHPRWVYWDWMFVFNLKHKLFALLWKERKVYTEEALMQKKTELKTGNCQKMAFNNVDPIIRIGNFLFCGKPLLIVIRVSKTPVFFQKLVWRNGGESSKGVKILYSSLPSPQCLPILLNNLTHFFQI